ncbi:transcriptional regulator [Streptomyces sp. SID3343]|uniref:transcriptional regulator n=1 Tax=Streptomyces sp. SID3343 TaxID=2690260 RepID=UPI0013708FF9|nr:transcriptional regulator [Streptomyces sp. SID3343]MYW04451.1 transcriptional regulator [Streptomyces sp. SID3343]
MPYRSLEPGKYGMRGTRASALAAQRLDELADGVTSPVDTERGLAARLRYLTTSHAGYAAMDTAGITVTSRTLAAWLAEDQTPNRANLRRIEAAYRDLRRRNVARSLTGRLNNNGRGTRVELHPHDQSGVREPHRRAGVAGHRNVNVRRWDAIVRAWAAGDEQRLDELWTDEVLADLGSDWGGFEFASGVGFAA